VPPVLLVLAIGGAVGFLGGLLGKGGSAVATPVLVACGVPPVIAVAAPLPATIPGTLLAADRYRRRDLIDRDVVRWSVIAGLPATIAGALASRWVPGEVLVLVTDVVLVALGLRLVFSRTRHDDPAALVEHARRRRVGAIAVVTGFVAGLLANGGGFLLAPLFMTVARLPVKAALGTSLAVAAALAVPGSLVHLALGHLEWTIVVAFGLGSIPLSGVGARVALRIDGRRLERLYGAALAVLGVGFVVASLG
jgi:uncharacterized membrane protein YfcA